VGQPSLLPFSLPPPHPRPLPPSPPPLPPPLQLGEKQGFVVGIVRVIHGDSQTRVVFLFFLPFSREPPFLSPPPSYGYIAENGRKKERLLENIDLTICQSICFRGYPSYSPFSSLPLRTPPPSLPLPKKKGGGGKRGLCKGMSQSGVHISKCLPQSFLPPLPFVSSFFFPLFPLSANKEKVVNTPVKKINGNRSLKMHAFPPPPLFFSPLPDSTFLFSTLMQGSGWITDYLQINDQAPTSPLLFSSRARLSFSFSLLLPRRELRLAQRGGAEEN